MSKLLDPDFWVAAWSKLLEPDFWVTLWSTFLGFEFWGTVWKAFSAPEVVIPLVPLLLIATYVGWKIKGGFDKGKIKGMKTQIDAAEQRLLSANEQRAAGADVDREVETLRKQVFESQDTPRNRSSALRVGGTRWCHNANGDEAVLCQQRTAAYLHRAA